MHSESQTPNLPDGPLFGRVEVLRSSQLEDRRHRFGSDDDPGRLRERQKRTARATLAEALEGIEDLLAEVSTKRPTVPGQLQKQNVCRNHDPKNDESLGQKGGNQEAGLPARPETLLRNRTSRSRRGSADDQQVAGPREFSDDDGLLALPPRTLGQRAESARLATGPATADLPTASGKQLGERFRPEQEKLTLDQILRIGAAKIADDSMCAQVQSVLAKLSVCRTHVMGGRKFQCGDCGEVTSLYNSCGDRHCPQCSGSKRVDFNDKASKLILPGVTYYQVVFTLPSELSELALANRHEMADLLVGSAWKTLSANIKSEQDYEPAGISVLHTWNQKLDAHWHVHVLVPGEGPGLWSDTWKRAQSPPESPNSDGYYLVDADRLRDEYRKRAMRKLRRLRAVGKLKLGGKFEYLRSEENWEVFVKNLESKSWVAYIQPPPKVTSVGNEVVNYLTRYLTGGPISNHRIVAADRDEVTFMAREGKRIGGEREQIPITLSIAEFTRRWCLHIQPEQLTKTRYFGGWSNQKRESYLSRCRKLLPETDVQTAEATDDWQETVLLECPCCGSDRMRLLESTAKPSWKELFWRESETCPAWYADLLSEDHRRFWTDAYGSDFYDWYTETQVEGAKETEQQWAPPIQLHLFDLTPRVSFEIESY